MKFTVHLCTHTCTRERTHTHRHAHAHTNAGQSAWHQTAVHGQMRCVRAPCCQEADRKKKQTLSNGDMTCSPGRKLKQTINGPWSLWYSSKIPTAARPAHPTPFPVLTPSRSVPCRTRAFDISRRRPQARGDIFLPQPNSAGSRTKWTRRHQCHLTQRHKDHKRLKEGPNLHTTTTSLVKITEASHNQ